MPNHSPPSRSHNAADWTARWAEIAGDRVALVDAERRLDYAGLEDRVARCAGMLAAAGVGRGDRVALLLGNRSGYVESVLAAARIGAIAVPVNARFTAREVCILLDDCTPRLLLHEEQFASVASTACREARRPPLGLCCPGEYERCLAQAVPISDSVPVAPDDPMLLLYTSGTTGVPKGALLPHRKTLYNSLNAQVFFGIHAEDRVLVALPLFHSFGLCILTLPALYAGARVHLEPRFDAQRVWERVSSEQITYLGGVPTQLAGLLAALKSGASTAGTGSLRFLFGAGAAVPVEQIRAFQAQGIVLKQGFGQTETSILYCLDDRDALPKAGSVGLPVVHAEVRVVQLPDLDGPTQGWRDVPAGEAGEIVVRGPITMLGYWKRPEATAETLRGEWLRTGDLATRDEEGYVTLCGRARDLYISGGENVYPAEVEAVYAGHPQIAEIAVVGVPDERWGEVGHAYVVPRNLREDLDGTDALRAWGRERLAAFKLPVRFLAASSLPRTATGKVQKHRLSQTKVGVDGAVGAPRSAPVPDDGAW
ncbi:MAG: AMP-binding protein [Myxococcota bacterium]